MERKFLIQPLNLVETRRQQWAYESLIPMRTLTILAGASGIGKSTILAWLIAGLTHGRFEGDLKGSPVHVALIAAEDDNETTLVPRLIAANANLEAVSSFSTVEVTEGNGTRWRGLPRISSDLQQLKAELIEHGTRVLIIDPVLSIMDGDSIKSTDVRRNLDPLATLANELDIAIILVMHFNKGHGLASEKMSGSHSFRDVARSVLLLAVDDETDNRVLSVEKSNYSPTTPSFAFAVDTKLVPTSDGELASVGHARLLGESNVTVQDILDRQSDNSLGDVSTEILAFVTAADGEVTAQDVAAELDLTPGNARTYLGRLVNSGRIARAGRGRYSANDTADSTGLNVSSVSSVSKNNTLNTHNTHIRNDNVCIVHDSQTDDGSCAECNSFEMELVR